MTPADHNEENSYRTQERLGINCGSLKPTKEQLDRVNREVESEMNRLELIEVVEGWGGGVIHNNLLTQS